MHNKKYIFGRVAYKPELSHKSRYSHIIDFAGIGYHQAAGNMRADGSVIYEGGGLDNKR